MFPPTTCAYTYTCPLTALPLSSQVIVTDKGDPALSDSATVYLKIIDINDNEPVFEPAAYSATICENIGSEVLLFNFEVSDKLLTTDYVWCICGEGI